MRPNVSCLKCGWIHFEVSLAEAEGWVKEALKYRQTASLDDYKKCFRCGGSHEDFDVVDEDNIRIGVTIQPILARSERAWA